MRQALEAAKNLFKDSDIVGVEVGVHKGGNAFDILNSWVELKVLHLVDNYIGTEVNYKEAEVRLSPYKERIIWHLKSSEEAADEFEDKSVNFVYIDGSHVYENVKFDIRKWLPKIKKGGILGGHDYWKNEQGVIRAVDEFIKETGFKLNSKFNLDNGTNDWWIFL